MSFHSVLKVVTLFVFVFNLISDTWLVLGFQGATVLSWECENDPCDCNEYNLNCISSTCHSAAGCNQCLNGYFKYDYNYKCVHCQAAFGNACMFCQDFNGCGQCTNGYTRTKHENTGLWYCLNNLAAPDTIETPLGSVGDPTDEELTRLDNYMNGLDDNGNPIDESTLPDDDESFTTLRYDLMERSATEIDYSETFIDSVVNDEELNDELNSDFCFNCTSNDVDDLLNTDDDECDNDTDTRRRLVDLGWRIELTNTNSNPLRSVGILRYQKTQGGGDYQCTATLVSSRWILTAAHCIHAGGTGSITTGLFRNFRFYPRATRYNTFSNAGSYQGIYVWMFSSWFGNQRSATSDIAIMKLEYSIVNANLQYASLATNSQIFWLNAQNNPGSTTRLYLAGYPASTGSRLYYTKDKLYRKTTGRAHTDDTDTRGGQSGAPVWAYHDRPRIHAVHRGGSSWGGRQTNVHTRVTKWKRGIFRSLIF